MIGIVSPCFRPVLTPETISSLVSMPSAKYLSNRTSLDSAADSVRISFKESRSACMPFGTSTAFLPP